MDGIGELSFDGSVHIIDQHAVMLYFEVYDLVRKREQIKKSFLLDLGVRSKDVA